MVEIPIGFSFDESEDGFVIRKKTADGAVTEIKMEPKDLYGLKTAIDLWTDRRMSTFRAASGSVHPVVVQQIAKVGLWPDAVGENVLLKVEAPSGGKMTLSVPLAEADTFAFFLPRVLARMRAEQNPTKQ